MKATLGWILLALVLLALAASGLRAFLEHRAVSALGPAEKAFLHEMQTRVLIFDPKDIDPPLFDPVTIAAVTSVHAQYKASEDDARRFLELSKTGGRSTSRSVKDTSGCLELSCFDSLTTAVAALVAQPDYELNALTAAPLDQSGTRLGLPEPGFLEVNLIVNLAQLQSGAALEAGRIGEAMEWAETIVRVSHTHRFSSMMSHITCAFVSQIGTFAWHDAVKACDDPFLLRRTLDRQSHCVSGVSTLTSGLPIAVVEAVSDIRQARRLGLQSPVYGGTGLQLMAEQSRLQAEYLERFMLPHLTDPQEMEQTRGIIRDRREQAAHLARGGQSIRVLAAWLVSGSSQSEATDGEVMRELLARTNTAKARFEILRIVTAAKIYRLEKGKEATCVQDLVPAYLQEVPVDVFSPQRASYELRPGPHSVGPDGLDHKAAVLYDPTNGTVSAGDIVLRPVGR